MFYYLHVFLVIIPRLLHNELFAKWLWMLFSWGCQLISPKKSGCGESVQAAYKRVWLGWILQLG
jgi:hypothetical protein